MVCEHTRSGFSYEGEPYSEMVELVWGKNEIREEVRDFVTYYFPHATISQMRTRLHVEAAIVQSRKAERLNKRKISETARKLLDW